ncbi:MAG: discoidin domain-containing protein [Anaerolineaceae bacterium]
MAVTKIPINFMTSYNTPPVCVISASSEYTGGGGLFLIWKSIDGNNGTYGLLNSNSGWVKIDLLIPYILYSYSIRVNTVPEPNRAPKTFTMEGSRDNSNYSIIDTRTNEISWASGEERNYLCNSPAKKGFRYFKLNVSANNGDSLTQFAEISLFTRPFQSLNIRGRDRIDLRGVSANIVL